MQRLEERFDSRAILDARRALHARRHIDAERLHLRDRLGHVVGRQPAGQNDTAGRRSGCNAAASVNAFTAGRPVASTSAIVSSPCSCTALSGTRLATPFMYSGAWFTNTPTGATNGGSVRTIARARYGSMNRGLSGQNTNPSAPAPASTAAHASSARVIPQIFT